MKRRGKGKGKRPGYFLATLKDPEKEQVFLGGKQRKGEGNMKSKGKGKGKGNQKRNKQSEKEPEKEWGEDIFGLSIVNSQCI